MLTANELERYARHIVLREVGGPGQAALKEASGLPVRPDRAEAERMAEAWRPLRGVAAQLLWAYYLRRRGGRDSAPAPSRPAELEETS